ncbi:major facilitator superfamily MFS-1 protein [Theileria orientalis]|uniref:Major facilitator superfamily MFS-1 protein n=1 Tax=Theileria orientalis TaxID=68886 RepID=A0A976M5M1_THEOR|nr:major facilitator superfamily MFS-1 protein [Theileria orientalis]
MKTDGIVTDPSSVENVSSIEERSNDVLHYDEPTIKPGRHKKWTREYRYTFYFFIINFVFDLLINYDIGAIPVMLNWIQDQFKFTSTELGVVGSLNYLSVFMFSTFWSYLFSNYSSKKSLTASVLIVGLSLVLFGLAVNKYMFFVAKFCKGYGHSGFALFFPLWVDTFAPSEHRNLWMSVLQSALSLGSTLGYIITSLFSYAGKHGWRYSVLTQLVLLSLTVVLFWMVPKKFIEVIPSRGDKVKFDLCTCEKAAYNPPTQQEDISRVHANFDSSTINSENPKCSKCFISTAKQCRGSAKIKTMSTIRKYVFLFRNIIFILSCLVISSIYFVIFGAQFWMTKVVVNHFNIEERKVFFIFSYIFLTSQITGLVCGSYLTDKIVYHYPHEPLYVDYALIGFTSVQYPA